MGRETARQGSKRKQQQRTFQDATASPSRPPGSAGTGPLSPPRLPSGPAAAEGPRGASPHSVGRSVGPVGAGSPSSPLRSTRGADGPRREVSADSVSPALGPGFRAAASQRQRGHRAGRATPPRSSNPAAPHGCPESPRASAPRSTSPPSSLRGSPRGRRPTGLGLAGSGASGTGPRKKEVPGPLQPLGPGASRLPGGARPARPPREPSGGPGRAG